MAKDRPGQESQFDELWRAYLNGGEEALQQFLPPLVRPLISLSKHGLALIPSSPRCLWCNAPFRGPGGLLMKMIGRDQSNYNPSICQSCEAQARRNEGGAEVRLTMLFADVRGSTTLAEEMNPVEFSRLIFGRRSQHRFTAGLAGRAGRDPGQRGELDGRRLQQPVN